jgi:D-alanine-D-alanine ligase
MTKINKRIEIVSSEIKKLSSMSKESCASILAVLSKHFTEVGVTVINDPTDLEVLINSHPDLVFLGMEFILTDPALGLADYNKIWLSDVLDKHEILYTGSAQLAYELGRNKHLAKQRVLDASLKTSAYLVVERAQSLNKDDVPLRYPLFIKPTNRGGGLGIDSDSVVHNFEQLWSKVNSITTDLQSDALIEEYLPGREFSVAILKDGYSAGYLAMPIELIAPPDRNGDRLLSDQIKSSNVEQALEVTDPVVKSKVTALALAVFEALGARDYGRIDIRLDVDGTPHFLEANLIPSLISGYGSFPKACLLNAGLGYEVMIVSIAKLGLAHEAADTVEVTPDRPIFVPTETVLEPA